MTYKISPWMYRVGGENILLILTLVVALIVGVLLAQLDLWFIFIAIIFIIFLVRLEQAKYLGNAVRVREDQFPEIYKIYSSHASRLGIRKVDVYVHQDPYLNAFCLGIFSCTVVLGSALVEQMTDDELSFVIGHELGHYQAGHTKLTSLISTVGRNNWISDYLFGFWTRRCELSCDRCGLILNNDIDSCISALIKLSIGGKLYQYIDIAEYTRQLKSSTGLTVRLSEISSSHPYVANRVRHLLKFYKSSFREVATHEM